MHWDARPSLPQTATTMEVAAREYAVLIGVTTSKLRIKLSELRSLGYQAAIDAAKLEFEIEKDSSGEGPDGL